MGRRKIEIQPIIDERNRTVTFVKRKAGLFKKAHELSVLCQVDLAVIIFGNNNKLYEFSSVDTKDLLSKYSKVSKPQESKTPGDYGNYKKQSRINTNANQNGNASLKDEMFDSEDVDEEDSDEESTPEPKRRKRSFTDRHSPKQVTFHHNHSNSTNSIIGNSRHDLTMLNNNNNKNLPYKTPDQLKIQTTFQQQRNLLNQTNSQIMSNLNSNQLNINQNMNYNSNTNSNFNSKNSLPSLPSLTVYKSSSPAYYSESDGSANNSKPNQRPVLRVQIPINPTDKKNQDSATTITAIESNIVKGDNSNSNNKPSSSNAQNHGQNNSHVHHHHLPNTSPASATSANNTNTSSSSNLNIDRKAILPPPIQASSLLTGLSATNSKSSISTPVSASGSGPGPFFSLPQPSPSGQFSSNILPTPILNQVFNNTNNTNNTNNNNINSTNHNDNNNNDNNINNNNNNNNSNNNIVNNNDISSSNIINSNEVNNDNHNQKNTNKNSIANNNDNGNKSNINSSNKNRNHNNIHNSNDKNNSNINDISSTNTINSNMHGIHNNTHNSNSLSGVSNNQNHSQHQLSQDSQDSLKDKTFLPTSSSQFKPPFYPGFGNGEQTPISGLPSRYVNDLFPSPSNFYSSEWNIPYGTGNTPLPTSTPHFLPMPLTSNTSIQPPSSSQLINVSQPQSQSQLQLQLQSSQQSQQSQQSQPQNFVSGYNTKGSQNFKNDTLPSPLQFVGPFGSINSQNNK